MKLTYKHTLYASYLGYITQAIINNLAPLLFLIFQREFSISLKLIGLLISLNFGTQIVTDLMAAKLVDKIGYRICIITAHILCCVGLVFMGILPCVFSVPYIGLVIAVIINGIGGGLIEVLISPIVESLPSEEKSSAMSLLHSFYCWGQVGVVLLSTLYFKTIGTGYWYYLPGLWAFVPFFNIFLFIKVPMRTLFEDNPEGSSGNLFTAKIFWLFVLFMLCAGSSELAMSQWASLFAEAGLNVSKTVGNLLGPCAFALLMGIARLLFGFYGSKIKLENALILSSILCVASYLITVFSPIPFLSLAGCALCGFSVGIMWPGVFSLSAKHYPLGGTAMFALLALAGDIGCSTGPSIVGFISNAIEKSTLVFSLNWFPTANITEVGLKTGLLFVIVFPILMIVGVSALKRKAAL